MKLAIVMLHEQRQKWMRKITSRIGFRDRFPMVGSVLGKEVNIANYILNRRIFSNLDKKPKSDPVSVLVV